MDWGAIASALGAAGQGGLQAWQMAEELKRRREAEESDREWRRGQLAARDQARQDTLIEEARSGIQKLEGLKRKGRINRTEFEAATPGNAALKGMLAQLAPYDDRDWADVDVPGIVSRHKPPTPEKAPTPRYQYKTSGGVEYQKDENDPKSTWQPTAGPDGNPFRPDRPERGTGGAGGDPLVAETRQQLIDKRNQERREAFVNRFMDAAGGDVMQAGALMAREAPADMTKMGINMTDLRAAESRRKKPAASGALSPDEQEIVDDVKGEKAGTVPPASDQAAFEAIATEHPEWSDEQVLAEIAKRRRKR